MSIEITLATVGNILLGGLSVFAISFCSFLVWFGLQIQESDFLSVTGSIAIIALGVWALVSMPVF